MVLGIQGKVQVRKGKDYAVTEWPLSPGERDASRKQLAAEAKVRRLEEEVKLEWDMHLMQAVHRETLGCQWEPTGPATGCSGLACLPEGAEAEPSLNPGHGSAPRMEPQEVRSYG